MKRPVYKAYAAITLDGKIAKHKKHFSDWTSKEDKKIFQKELAKADVILVGMNTYRTAKKQLSKRNCVVLTRSVKNTPQKTPNILFCDPKEKHPKEIIKEKGYKNIAIIGGSETYSFALEQGMLDELHLTIEPMVFGEGIPLFAREVKNKLPHRKLFSPLHSNLVASRSDSEESSDSMSNEVFVGENKQFKLQNVRRLNAKGTLYAIYRVK